MKPLSLILSTLLGIMAQSLHLVLGNGCDQKFSSKDMKTGKISSPNFPSSYSELTTCHYYFESVGDGRIEVEFDYFELEGMEPGDTICRFDYIDVFSVDKMGYRTRRNRFCGKQIPPKVISVQPNLEIVFVSDHTKIASGFSAHFTFLDDSWRPFRPSTPGCGSEVLSGWGGLIISPDYPAPFRGGSECTWLIKVLEGQQIVVNIIALDLGQTSETCKDFKLLIFNGFATPDMLPEISLCGRLDDYSPVKRQFLSHSSRVVIRFISSETNVNHGNGFKLSWTAVEMPEDGPCGQFTCGGGEGGCVNDMLCEPSPRYCIHNSLKCDGIPNCGPFDDSDERKCPREIIIMTASIAIPSLGIILLVVLVIYCYRRKRVKKSTSQEQPLTTSHRQISRDSMASRGGKLVMHTSFIDIKPVEESETEIDPDSLPLPSPPPDLEPPPALIMDLPSAPPIPDVPPAIPNLPPVIPNLPPIIPSVPPTIPVVPSVASTDNGFMPAEPKTKSSLKKDSYTFSPPKHITYEDKNMIIAEI